MDAPPRVFVEQARDYERGRRRLIPPFDAFYGAALEGVTLASRPPARILDLGAGTGLLARRLAAAWPDAELTLLDGAAAMLDEARAALGERARYVVGDLADPLPDGRWDAVVSGSRSTTSMTTASAPCSPASGKRSSRAACS